MTDAPLVELRPGLVDGVAVVALLPVEITEPDVASRLGQALRSLFETGVSDRILIEMGRTKYLSSTAFAVLLKYGLWARERGGRVAICGMDPFVRVGADIVRLGQIVPILDDEPAGLAALAPA